MQDIIKLRELSKEFKILYVEDEDDLRVGVVNYLKKIFKNVSCAKDGLEGLQLYKKETPDIVITDIHMPNLNGIDMAKKIKELNKKQEIIIISAYTESKYFLDSIKIGVSGYIIKPINFDQMNEELYKTVYKLKKFQENELYNNNLENLIDQRTKEKQNLQSQIINNYQQTLSAFIDMVEKRDTYTGGHSQRVAEYSVMIAKELGCAESEQEKLYKAGILHDIGKISTPDSILLKPGKLNTLEYKLIQEHVSSGYHSLKKISMYKKLAEIIYCHHERYDGKGYPRALKDDEIPFLSKIMIVADAFDAMTTNRIYKKSKSIEDALLEIEKCSGTQFNPEVAQAAISVLRNVKIEKNIAQTPKTQIEEEKFSYFYKDQMVDAFNKNYLELMLLKNKENKQYTCINVFFIHGLAQYSKTHKWSEGDEILSKFALHLKENFEDSLVFRINGNHFVLLSKLHVEITNDFIKNISFIKDPTLSVEHSYLNLQDENIYLLDDLQQKVLFKI